MAIYSGRILMRRGLEADFDASKLMAGEWALSTDKGIVRICYEGGKVIRMATYEAFEEDMKKIEAILLECRSIEEAVTRINAEIDTKVDAVVDYVGQAKTYRDEAESFRDEAEQFRDEAEIFKNQAGEIAGIGIATNEKVGLVKPDGTTVTIDEDGTISSTASGGTEDYTDLNNKPSINGVVLSGNKTTAELNIKEGTTNYTELNNKPTINGVVLSGNLTDSDLNIQGVTDYKELTNKPSINGVELNGNLTLDTGTDNYAELKNKPTINGVELNGDLTSADIKLDSSGNVVDNLLSTSTTLPLSANQGRVLDEKITALNESLGYVPDYANATNISDGTFKPTKNGFVLISGYVTEATKVATFVVNGITLYFQSPINIRNSMTIPLAKDDTLVLTNNGATLEICKFIPSKNN